MVAAVPFTAILLVPSEVDLTPNRSRRAHRASWLRRGRKMSRVPSPRATAQLSSIGP